MTPAELELREYAVLGLVAEASHLALGYFGRSDLEHHDEGGPGLAHRRRRRRGEFSA